MDEAELAHLEKIQEAMKNPDVSLHPVRTFTHGIGVQVYVGNLKVGPIMFPSEEQTVPDLLHMLGTMIIKEEDNCEPNG